MVDRGLGNRFGWAIAAVLAVGFALVFRELAATNRPTAPTALLAQAAALEKLTTEVPASAILHTGLPTTTPTTAPADARSLFETAIVAIRAHPDDYAAAEAASDPAPFEATPACAALLAATNCPGDALADAPSRAAYEPPTDDLDALLQAARCLGRTATLRSTTDARRAGELFDAEFSLGVRLFDGRVRYAEAEAGLAIARDAAAGLRDLATRAGDTRRAATLSAFDRSIASLLDRRLSPLWQAIGTVDGNVIAAHAGDVVALAGRATSERMWRVEAILALGRHRFNAERAADRLIVPRRLTDLKAGETDAVILAAIHAAQGLTIEQFRTLR